ncbi:hypothetical protein [Rhodococcus sp. SG20037]|uniref:hypothetical protein n=1 Tax=Rhodococcus sp. SG20037 TaxID=3074148 RepID=UPI00287FEFA5|nr:hypothetical protein [Rhodococcus sp. SG20037]WNF44428.1 hypothetical protein RHP72_13915 [Rhodococcus sp. SG20037]
MSYTRRVLVISPVPSKLSAWAANVVGCEVVPRGRTEKQMEAAVKAMSRPADLIVLDGHGSGIEAIYTSSGRETQVRISFAPEMLGAPRVIMSICYGLAEHYIEKLTDCDKEIEVIGPVGTISSRHYLGVVSHLIERFLDGEDLMAALDGARRLELGQIERWGRSGREDRVAETD